MTKVCCFDDPSQHHLLWIIPFSGNLFLQQFSFWERRFLICFYGNAFNWNFTCRISFDSVWSNPIHDVCAATNNFSKISRYMRSSEHFPINQISLTRINWSINVCHFRWMFVWSLRLLYFLQLVWQCTFGSNLPFNSSNQYDWLTNKFSKNLKEKNRQISQRINLYNCWGLMNHGITSNSFIAFLFCFTFP